MANQEYLDLLKRGVEGWNRWKREHPRGKLDLSGANLSGTNLVQADLRGADLRGANLRIANLGGADLSGADLVQANLRGADLRGADLRGANLRGANLRIANLSGADLVQANLGGADLSGADLSGANLRGANLTNADLNAADLKRAALSNADLRGANLRMANLSRADLSGADLSGANLREALLGDEVMDGANLFETNLSGTSMLEYERERLRNRGAIGLDKVNIAIITSEPSREETPIAEVAPALHSKPKLKVAESTSTLYIRITQQPLTARNLTVTTSALTQLHTQCWLIAVGRFTDLIEYAQTHNPCFDEEANLTIAQMTHHSPAEITFNVSFEGVANALRTAIDAVAGVSERKRELELKNAALEEEIRRRKQETEVTLISEKIAQQAALVALYDQQIEMRRKQLDLLDYAAEKAPKIVEALNPNADTTTKAMAANTLIKALSQLGETEGLEHLLPPPDSKP